MAPNPREIQQFIDEQTHLLCPSLNALYMALGLRIEGGTEFFHEKLGKAPDMAQGRPQVMRHGVTESFQFSVGRFQLGRSLYDPMLEFVIEFSDFSLICFPLRNVADSHHSSTIHAFFVSEGATSNLDPGTARDLWIAHKYLAAAHLTVDRTYQGKLFGGEGSDSIWQIGAIMF